ncbi:MAG: hypothetical protein WCT77_01600 [Bacteroidota bacterium]
MEEHNELSLPISIRLVNNTTEIINNVKVFDFKHEKQGNIQYFAESPFLTYDEILRRLISGKYNIIEILHETDCKNINHTKKQTSCCIYLQNTDILGVRKTKQYKFKQEGAQLDMAVSKTDFWLDVNMNIIYDFILPKTTIVIRFYPAIEMPLIGKIKKIK